MSSIRFNPQPKVSSTDKLVAKVKQKQSEYDATMQEVYRRDGRKCYSGTMCVGKILKRPPSITPSHIIPCGRNGVRIDTPENIIPQCATCNEVAANGTAAFGKRMTGDEFMLKVLEMHQHDRGFKHHEGLAYMRKMAAKQKIERGGK